MIDWEERLSAWRQEYGCKIYKAVERENLYSVATTLVISVELLNFYSHCNGISLEWFRILPIENPTDIKHTWDSLSRANDSQKSRFTDDDEFLNRFLIFAHLDAGRCVVMDRADGSIWYEDDEYMHRITSNLSEFIEISLKEVVEL